MIQTIVASAIVVSIAFGFFVLWLRMRKDMRESFKAMSLDALNQSSDVFLNLAKTHLEKFQEGARSDLDGRQKAIEASMQPLKAAMLKLDEQYRDMEKQRSGAYSALHKQLDMMINSDRELRQETSQLVQALRSPNIRGSWGQVHLRRVVELAGLVNQCDFYEQVTLIGEAKSLRPDLIVRLPGARQIVVDAKTPLNSFLDAADSLDEDKRKKCLNEHALSIRKHIKDLSSKEYWKTLEISPEYVILFLPAESFFSSALQVDPSLIEVGASQNIVVATPTTLIAILRAVAFSWKQESLSKSAQEIAKLGGELYDRLGTVYEHWNKVGRNLGAAVQSYNQSIVSLESRALVSARKLKECAGITKELPVIDQLEQLVRE